MTDSSPQARFDRQIAHLRRVFEQERQLLAYDLHDGVLQDLVAAKWALEANLGKVQSGQPLDTNLLATAQDLVGNAVAELRQTILEHRPFALGKQNLSQAIEEFIQRLPSAKSIQFDLQVEIDCSQIRGDLQMNLYRIVQQAVYNSLSHAQPANISVTLARTSTAVTLTVTDNGTGFESPDSPRSGLGLESIRERTRMFDGTCRIESKPGLGTTIEVTIPLAFDDMPTS